MKSKFSQWCPVICPPPVSCFTWTTHPLSFQCLSQYKPFATEGHLHFVYSVLNTNLLLCFFFLQGSPHCSKPSLKSYFQKDLPGPHFKVVSPLPPPPSHHHWCCHSLLIPPSQNLSHSDFLLASPAVPGTLSFLLSILPNLIMIPCTLEMCHLSAKCKKWINVRNRN